MSTALVTPQHTITALVQNETGTINRLVSLFRRRGFSIACFNAGDCEQPGYSRITLVVNGSEDEMRQCVRQLEKLIDVVEAEDLGDYERISRELVLVKIDSGSTSQTEVELRLAGFDAFVVAWGASAGVVQACVKPEQVESFLQALAPASILEIVRTGAVAIKASDLN